MTMVVLAEDEREHRGEIARGRIGAPAYICGSSIYIYIYYFPFTRRRRTTPKKYDTTNLFGEGGKS